MRGLDPRIHQSVGSFKSMDCRVGDRHGDRKPGNDEGGCAKQV